MSINVVSTPNLGTPSGQISAIKDLQREMDAVRAARGYIGPQAIGSNHIGQSQITAGHIEAGSIGATHISANAIQTVHLDAQVVTAAKLAATLTISSIIQTAASGSRVVLSNAGLYAYDSLNAEKLGFDIDTGSMRIAGALTAGSGSALPITYLTSGSLVTGTVFRLDSGGYFETSPTNPRVVIDSAGWRSYDAAGVLTTEITNSSATFQGATFRTGAPTAARVQMDSAGLFHYSDASSWTARFAPGVGLQMRSGTADPNRLTWVRTDGTIISYVQTGQSGSETNTQLSLRAHGITSGYGEVLLVAQNPGLYDATLKVYSNTTTDRYVSAEVNAFTNILCDHQGYARVQGRLRIGSTTAPAYGLHVDGGAKISTGTSEALRLVDASQLPYISFYNTNDSTRFGYVQGYASGVVVNADSTASVFLSTAGTTRATISSAGLTIPASHVLRIKDGAALRIENDAGTAEHDLSATPAGSPGGGTNYALTLYGPSGQTANAIKLANWAGNVYGWLYAAAGGGWGLLAGNGAWAFRMVGTENNVNTEVQIHTGTDGLFYKNGAGATTAQTLQAGQRWGTATAYNTYSSRLIKKNIRAHPDRRYMRDGVKALQVRQFDYRDHTPFEVSGPQTGLIAEEVEEQFPWLVSEVREPGTDAGADVRPMIKGFDYGMLTVPLIAAVQDHEEEIAGLREELDTLRVGTNPAVLAALERLDRRITALEAA